MKILAIETSCDETAIAIADFARAASGGARVRVLSHLVSSQTNIHARFGGVVPNLARREHERNLVPVTVAALKDAKLESRIKKVPSRHSRETCPRENGGRESRINGYNCWIPDQASPQLDWGSGVTKEIHEKLHSILNREPELLRQFKKYIVPLASPEIDAIAVTYGPGLAPALWTGVNFARALAVLWDKSLIPVNHMAGHFFSALLQKSEKGDSRLSLERVKFPILALLVSGNHTELILVKKPWQFQIIGSTLDDAAGEAFDKVARIMGFPYPGGPAISRLAEKGNPKTYPLPSPMLHSKNYDFSFSGLKTAAFYLIRDITGSMSWKTKSKLTMRQKADIAASFEKAAIDVLVKKTIRATKEYKAKTVLVGGGVAANKLLRRRLAEEIGKESPHSKLQIPSSDLCGDNALMIAAAAYMCGKKKDPALVRAEPNLRLS